MPNLRLDSIKINNYYKSGKELFRIIDLCEDSALVENCKTEKVDWLKLDTVARLERVIPNEG